MTAGLLVEPTTRTRSLLRSSCRRNVYQPRVQRSDSLLHRYQQIISLWFVIIALLKFASLLPCCNGLLPPGVCHAQAHWRQHTCRPSSLVVRFAKSGKKKKKPKDNTICVNRLAYRNYEIIDTLEAGIALKGTEVKSVRDGKMNIRDGYVRPSKNGRSCVLHNVHIGKHTMVGPYFQHEEKRPRDLLVHKQEARRLLQQTEQKGMTIVPIKAYFNEKNMVKLQIALCRGKNVRDKRADIKAREAKREESRIIKSFRV